MLYPADQSKIRTAVLWAEPILNPSERERILNPKVTMDLEDHFDGGSDHGDYKFCDFHSSPAPNHLFFLKHFHPSIIQSHCFKLRLICEVFWMAPPLLSGGGRGDRFFDRLKARKSATGEFQRPQPFTTSLEVSCAECGMVTLVKELQSAKAQSPI